ncbi:MAG: hypothetical protein QXO76_03935 [Thermoproteota archaeon]
MRFFASIVFFLLFWADLVYAGRGFSPVVLVVPEKETYADVIRRVCSKPYSPNDATVISEKIGARRILDRVEELAAQSGGSLRVIGPFTAGVAWDLCRLLNQKSQAGGGYRFYFPLLSAEECHSPLGTGTFYPLMRMSRELMERFIAAGWRRFEIVTGSEKVFRVIEGMLMEICHDRGVSCSSYDGDEWSWDVDDESSAETAVIVAGGVDLFREVVDSRPSGRWAIGFVHVDGDLTAAGRNVLVVTGCRDGRCGSGLERQFSVLCERTWIGDSELFGVSILGSISSP